MEQRPYRDLPYLISPNGAVYSLIQNRFLPGTPHREGYISHTLKGRLVRLTHQIVMEVYGPPKPDDIQDWVIDHIDENTSNNHISNLRWLTRRENLARKPSRKGVRYSYTPHKLSIETCREILGKHRKRINTREMLAEEYGVSPSMIKTALSRARKDLG